MKSKGIFSKLTSVFLACTLVATLTPFPAFAEEAEGTTGEEEAASTKLAEEGQLLKPNGSTQLVDIQTEFDCIASLNATATSGYCGDTTNGNGKNISWTYDGKGTLTLKGSGVTVDPLYVKSDPPGWWNYRDKITKLVIGNGITKLNNSIFTGLSISTVKMPSSMKEISYYAFKDCSKLTSIELNEGLEVMSEGALDGTALTSLYIPSTVKDLDYTYRRVVPLSKITISPNSKNLIKKDNLLYTYDMTRLCWADESFSGAYKVPDTVTAIGICAFEATYITSIDLGSNMKNIASGAFNLCRQLSGKITIPKSVTHIGRQAFSNMSSSFEVDLQCSNATFYGGMFCYSSGLQTVKIAEGIPYFGCDWTESSAFCLCTSLKSVTLPKSFKIVRMQDFAGCSSLTSVTFGGNESELGYQAFGDCTSLKSIQLPNKLTSIGSKCFSGTPLISLTVPNSVEAIGTYAFASSTKLAIPKTLIQLADTSYVSDKNATSFSVNMKHSQTEARKLINLVNNFRKESGVWYWNSDNATKTYPKNLTQLKYDKDLEQVAIKRAEELVLSFSHTRPDGSSCFTAYPSGFTAMGENIAAGFGSSQAVMEGWKETNYNYSGQGHRRNMLSSNYNCAGYACVEYNGVKYWVQEFGYRATPNTSVGSANDSTSAATFTLPNSKITAAENNASDKVCELIGKGASKKIPTVTGSVTINGKKLPATFNLTWRSKDATQVKVENGTATALVANNTTYVYSYIKGAEVRISTKKQVETNRLYGNDCFGTNLATLKADVSENGLPKGIIVCTNTHYVDSLSAAALSGLLNYPIVIANGSEKQMNSTVKQSINVVTNSGKQKLDIVILGGSAAVSSGIELQLKAYDSNGKCDRVYGSDGYDTNQKAYEYGKSKNGGWNTSEVLVATGSAYYDALGSGSYAAAKKAFILLANPSGSNAGMLSKVNKGVKVTICGGKSAVSSNVESSVKAKGCTINRLSGDDAYKTNIKFVQYSVKQGMRLEGAGVSTGTGYWDALGSSHILGASSSVMFLVNPNESLNQGVYSEFKNSKETISKARVFGGSSAVTDTTRSNIQKACA